MAELFRAAELHRDGFPAWAVSHFGPAKDPRAACFDPGVKEDLTGESHYWEFSGSSPDYPTHSDSAPRRPGAPIPPAADWANPHRDDYRGRWDAGRLADD